MPQSTELKTLIDDFLYSSDPAVQRSWTLQQASTNAKNMAVNYRAIYSMIGNQSLPAGGNTYDMLVKASGDDFDYLWQAPRTSFDGGGANG